jgi:undecaprenyl-diphosphatase
MIKTKYPEVLTGALAAAFILFTALCKTVDLQTIGPESSVVGFASINGFFRDLIGTHTFFYVLSEFGGILAIFTALLFAGIGGYQLYQNKDIRKVDKNMLLMGCMYVLILVLYILFDKIPVNYRPVIMDEGLEPSYPSTHTLLAGGIFGCALVELRYFPRIRQDIKLKIRLGLIIAMVLTILFRWLSGVHWFTDILGGILLSFAVAELYYTLIRYTDK